VPTRVERLLWDLYATCYDGLLSLQPYRRLVEQVVDLAALTGHDEVLELGVGTGNIALRALDAGVARYDAVDVSHAMAQRARRKLVRHPRGDIATVHTGDAVAHLTSLPDASLDRIIASNVLYALGDRESLWTESMRALRPGGFMVVTNSDRRGNKPIIAEHLRHDSWTKLLSPPLLGVGVIDTAISLLDRSGTFDFAPRELVEKEIDAAGGRMTNASRTYGGEVDGVNLLFRVERA
jgi:ubiquinone/menaquinone biosynthesis C-methylase UbiE